MKILLLGANGQVGWELGRSLAPLAEVTACDRSRLDLENMEALASAVRDLSPGIIVNAAAYTAVDRAESEPERARRVNAEAVGVLADAAKRNEALLVTYSTDYVFDGKKTEAYGESDTPAPLNVYGKTKLEGEQAVAASGCRHIIFRTSWVYARRGGNFIRSMLRLARTQDELRVVDDQVGAPTHAGLIADVTALALHEVARHDRELNGIYHVVPGGAVSWHGYARFVIGQAIECGAELKVQPDQVRPIPTREYPRPAARPANSRLNTTRLRSTLGLALPSWEYDVARTVREIVEQEGGE